METTLTETKKLALDAQQQRAFDIMQSGKNVFLTGMAGTGKSFLIQNFIGSSFRSTEMCATTGIAALNLQQSIYLRTGINIAAYTVYRWAGMGIGPAAGQPRANFYDTLEKSGTRSFYNACRRIKKAECLIIDEVSMLPGAVMDYLDYHCQRIRDDTRPFGGIQIIVVGDVLQLPPVSKTGVYDWCFLSRAWKDAQFTSCYLTTIHRQSEAVFINLLNDFREGRIRGETADILQNRVAIFPDKNIVRIFTHNNMVDKWNEQWLNNLEGEERTFVAIESGAQYEVDFIKKNLVTPERLRLRIGARVMFTANCADKTTNGMLFANGECGIVVGYQMSMEGFCDSSGKCGVPLVRKDDGRKVLADCFTWAFDPYRKDETGKFTQVPLRVAYALTVHKSQGLTLDRAIVDIRAAMEPGQAYVAVSRVRTLEGLLLKDKIAGVRVSDDAIRFDRGCRNASAV